MTPRQTTLSRRRFLGAAAGGAAGVLILPSSRQARAYPANERLRLAVFGTMYNAAHFLTAAHIYQADIVAVCNPDQRKIPGIFQQWAERADQLHGAPQADQRQAGERYRRMAQGEGVKIFSDIRQLFGEMADGIDALVVSDYDHFHGVACGAALRAGKPVCSERPLGLTIRDARSLRRLAAETNVPTTYRSPGTGSGPFRRAIELVQDGAIGRVEEVHIWFDRGGPDRDATPAGSQPVPDGLDWDLWLGPLAWREYHPDWMAYAHWRETSNGGLGSFGPHTSIFPFLTLGLRPLWDLPETVIRVRAECARRNRVSFPRWERVRWEIPARGQLPPVAITWHHGPDFGPETRAFIHEKLGRFGVSTPEAANALMGMAGSLLVGSDGALVADDHSVHVTGLPRDRFAQLDINQPQRIGGSQGIYKDWMDACRGETRQILARFDNGGPLSELLMLGNLATRFPGETLAYNPAAGEITSHPAAAQLLGFPYRHGWQI
jgi:predicted dehydrogenase